MCSALHLCACVSVFARACALTSPNRKLSSGLTSHVCESRTLRRPKNENFGTQLQSERASERENTKIRFPAIVRCTECGPLRTRKIRSLAFEGLLVRARGTKHAPIILLQQKMLKQKLLKKPNEVKQKEANKSAETEDGAKRRERERDDIKGNVCDNKLGGRHKR